MTIHKIIEKNFAEQDKEKIQTKMFGMTLDEVKKEPWFAGNGNLQEDLMYAMQILSDAQHVMAHGQTEEARQFINKAKFWIAEVKQYTHK